MRRADVIPEHRLRRRDPLHQRQVIDERADELRLRRPLLHRLGEVRVLRLRRIERLGDHLLRGMRTRPRTAARRRPGTSSCRDLPMNPPSLKLRRARTLKGEMISLSPAAPKVPRARPYSLAESAGGIDARGARGGTLAASEADGEEREAGGGERQGVERQDAEEQAVERLAERRGAGGSITTPATTTRAAPPTTRRNASPAPRRAPCAGRSRRSGASPNR